MRARLPPSRGRRRALAEKLKRDYAGLESANRAARSESKQAAEEVSTAYALVVDLQARAKAAVAECEAAEAAATAAVDANDKQFKEKVCAARASGITQRGSR